MDYELIDTGQGRKLERFGQYLIDRPDPEILWQKTLPESEWLRADAKFIRTHEDKGRWETKPNFPESWLLEVDDLKMVLKLSPFKHLGIFPEQVWEWDFIKREVHNYKEENNMAPNIINLFGYTGAASISALSQGAKVTHVDASRPAISWFNENLKVNSLENESVRFIPEDCIKFVEREIKRGTKYDGIIMDPPVYGHGPQGEKWSFTNDFPRLVEKVANILSDNPIFIIVNAYAISSSPTTIANILQERFASKFGGNVSSGELTLKEKSGNRILSTGIWSIWSKNNL